MADIEKKQFLDLDGLERFWDGAREYLQTCPAGGHPGDAYVVPAGKQVSSIEQKNGKVKVTFGDFGGPDKAAARSSLGVSSSAELEAELDVIRGDISDLDSGKADKVVPASAGNLASLDAGGNLADSLVSPAQLKRIQQAWSTTVQSNYTVQSVSQNANGNIEITFQEIPTATTSNPGLVQLSSATDSVSETMAATPKAVSDAIQHAQGDIDAAIGNLDATNAVPDGHYITDVNESNGIVSITTAAMDTAPSEYSTKPVTSGGVQAAIHNEQLARDAFDTWVDSLIPRVATAQNQLADKAYVDAIGERVEARYLSYSYSEETGGLPFPTYAAFVAAQRSNTFYYIDQLVNPNGNDVIVVTADETHLNDNHQPCTTRYRFFESEITPGTGEWRFEYVINNSALNEAQLRAINSGITATKVGDYDAHLADTGNPHSVTKAQVGLGNVDNTADLDKPISAATQAALYTKVDKLTGTHQEGNIIVVGNSSDAIKDSGVSIRSYYAPEDTLNPATGTAIKQAIQALDPVTVDPNPSAASNNFVTSVDLVEVVDPLDPDYKTDYLQITRARPTIGNIDGLSDALDGIAGDIAGIVAGKADKDADAVAGNIAEFDGNGNPVDSGHALSEYKTRQSAVTVNPASSTNSLTFLTSFGQDANGEITGAIAATVPDASTSGKGVAQLTDSTSTASSTLAATATAVKAAYDHADTVVSGLSADVTGTGTNIDVNVVESNGLVTQVNVTDRTPAAIANAIEALDATVRTDENETGTAQSRNIDLTVTQADGVLTGITVNRDDSVNAGDLASAISTAVGNMDATVRTDGSETGTADNRNIDLTVTQVDGVLTGITVNRDETENRNNRVSSFQATPDDAHYPSEKLVKDSLDLKADKSGMAITAVADATKKNIQLMPGLSQDVVVAHQDITGKADRVSGATAGNFAGLDANGNLTDSGNRASDFATYGHVHGSISTDGKIGSTADLAVVTTAGGLVSAASLATADPALDSAATITAISNITQDSRGKISATKKAIQDGTTSQKGVVQLSSAVDSGSETEAATPLAVSTVNALVTGLGTSKADKDTDAVEGNIAKFDSNGNPVDSGAEITSTYDGSNSTDPVTGAAVSSAIAGKADRVSGATSGNLAGLDSSGNLTDSGKKASDFATAAQGSKADTAVQGVKVNGTELTKDANNKVNVTAVTGVKGDAESDYRTGQVNITAGNVGAYTKTEVDTSLSGKEDAANKAQSIDSSSSTDYPSSAAVASFVNSSIATATANFLGTLSLTDLGLQYGATNTQIAAALGTYAWPAGVTPTNNDYCFVAINNPSTTAVDEYRRFKFDGSAWKYEYTLNNSSFTQAQWDAINSGLSASDKTAYDTALGDLSAHIADTGNPHNVTKGQVGLGDVVNTGDSAVPVSGGTTKFTTGGAYTELSKKVDKVTSAGENHIAVFDNAGNIKDSGKTYADFQGEFKPKQTAVTVSGLSNVKTITAMSQDADGVISVTAEGIRTATTGRTGIVQLNDTVTSTSTSQAATANAVKTAYDHADSVVAGLDVASVGGAGKYISAISETDGKISATATDMDTTPTASSTNAVTSGGVKTALDDKVDVANINLNDQTTTLLAQVKALGAANKDYARFYTSSDAGSANISDKPVSGSNGFLCEAMCSRRVSESDYRYQLICWVKYDLNPYVAYVTGSSTSISWSRLNTQTITGVKGEAESSYRTGDVNLTPANLSISATSTSVTVGSTTFNQYVHPTTSGNKHVPSGGSSGQFLGWSADGTAAWVSNPNTDTKVKATAKTDNVEYKILATASASPTSGNATEAVYDADITLNPSTNTIAANISGNAATATKPAVTALNGSDDLNDAIGSTQGDVLWYRWANGYEPANSPTSGTAEMEVVRMHSGNYCVQTVYAANTEYVYRRVNKNGTWSSWYAYSKSTHTHGNITNGGALQTTDITVASGDKLVVTDASDSSKVARTSLAFDGSTASKALTQKGTFESVMLASDAMSFATGNGLEIATSGTTATLSMNISAIPTATITSLIAGLG